MKYPKPQLGFTLIETLIYVALFLIVIGGGLASVYQIIESSDKTQLRIVAQDEVNFVLRKIDWALTGASAISLPASGSSGPVLRLIKDGQAMEFTLTGGIVYLQRLPAAKNPITTQNIAVTNLNFQHIPQAGQTPPAVRTTFEVSGQTYEIIKYLNYVP